MSAGEARVVQGLLGFIQKSPTPFHAVNNMLAMLEQAGFQRLREQDAWHLQEGGRYVVTRNDSSIIAFQWQQPVLEYGIRMVGAHTDSPCLKLKPNPEMRQQGMMQLGVEVYGGALLNPWFDRDLSIAGRLSFVDEQQAVQSCLVDLKRAVAVIPSLAIHLDRDANDKRSINKQKHLPPVCLMDAHAGQNFEHYMLTYMREHVPAAAQAVKVLAHELSLYDTQAPVVLGLQDEWVAAARLDNLLSCFVGVRALIEHAGEGNALLVCNDHEEVGSMSAAGAQGTFLRSVLSRWCGDGEALARTMASSVMLSADNAHALHPNFADKHEPAHAPLMGQGPVLKINANQRYASNSETSALFKQACEQVGVPVQTFVVRSDMGCGSTIGPIAASELGVATVDVGVPTWAMHSIRETAACKDVEGFYKVLVQYYGML